MHYGSAAPVSPPPPGSRATQSQPEPSRFPGAAPCREAAGQWVAAGPGGAGTAAPHPLRAAAAELAWGRRGVKGGRAAAQAPPALARPAPPCSPRLSPYGPCLSPARSPSPRLPPPCLSVPSITRTSPDAAGGRCPGERRRLQHHGERPAGPAPARRPPSRAPGRAAPPGYRGRGFFLCYGEAPQPCEASLSLRPYMRISQSFLTVFFQE